MEVLRPVLDSSRAGLFGGMKQKKKRGREYFCPDRFWSTLFLKMFRTSKWAKLNGFEQLTSRAFRIRSQILMNRLDFWFRAFLLRPNFCRHRRVKTPAPPSRPQRRRGFFRCSAMNCDPQKKNLGIVAPHCSGHLVSTIVLWISASGTQKMQKTDFTSADFTFLSTPAEPNHKNAPKIR